MRYFQNQKQIARRATQSSGNDQSPAVILNDGARTFAAPARRNPPFLLDMATTTVAVGKIFKAFFEGAPQIPAGWAMDTSGVPTTDTPTAYQGLLMPLGGYKGSGLGLLVEILCGVLGILLGGFGVHRFLRERQSKQGRKKEGSGPHLMRGATFLKSGVAAALRSWNTAVSVLNTVQPASRSPCPPGRRSPPR